MRDGLLHPECKRLFRDKRSAQDPGTRTLTLHRHQREAIEVAREAGDYVVTTGTGSGKSLTYIIPIVDAVLRDPDPGRIKAIVVYPMNALANSQQRELRSISPGASPPTSGGSPLPSTPARRTPRPGTGS